MTTDRDSFEGPGAPAPRATRTLLQDLSRDLTHCAALLAHFAEREERRRAARGGPLNARQLAALIAARRARSAVFGFDLANPGWSLLLELYRARLAGEPSRIAALPVLILAAPSTVARWLARLEEAGHVARGAGPKRGTAALTDPAADAMADYFTAAGLG
jgi:DNA-binding MarR family transcriptional regulator